MKRYIYTTILIFIAFAAQAHQLNNGKADDKQTIVEYVSMSNDFASIRMEMYDNGKFIIRINPEDGKSLKLKGRWEKKGNNYILKFKKSQVAVNKLFNMNDPNRFEVLNDNDIRFSGHLSSLWIWGIQCKRAELI